MEAPFPADCAARFRCERRLAQGGSGAVYLAEQIGLTRPAAVKLLLTDVLADRESVERFVNEGRITAAIEPPCVVHRDITPDNVLEVPRASCARRCRPLWITCPLKYP